MHIWYQTLVLGGVLFFSLHLDAFVLFLLCSIVKIDHCDGFRMEKKSNMHVKIVTATKLLYSQ
jgi:hypothetical protein